MTEVGGFIITLTFFLVKNDLAIGTVGNWSKMKNLLNSNQDPVHWRMGSLDL